MQALVSGLRWLWDNVDPVVALGLAIVFSILGVYGVASQQVISNVVLATLAVIAFTLVRERAARSSASAEVSSVLEQRLSKVDSSIAQVREAIGMIDTLIKPTQGRFLTHDFEQAILNTRFWIYKGGTGTYLRAVTLPGNAENALRHRTRREISIEILDPTNLELCDQYGRMRRALDPKPDRSGETWTTTRVRNESYATILAAAYYRDATGCSTSNSDCPARCRCSATTLPPRTSSSRRRTEGRRLWRQAAAPISTTPTSTSCG